MTINELKEIIQAEFPEVDQKRIESFEAMEALYMDWNSKINVISRKDMGGFFEHHILHSLAIASYWKRTRNERGASTAVRPLKVLDLGTGGGFPGIPLAIMCPQMQFTLCDSIGKKIRVASEVASSLHLDNVVTVNARAESLTESFDFVVSRAVTSLSNFYPWVKDKFTGSIFYLKGGDVCEEIAVLMSQYNLRKGSVHSWKIENWLDREYFAEKFVIEIEKDYLCSPIVG